MTGFAWLASYPKSGNTWFRMVLGALALPEGGRLDINALDIPGGIASSRGHFDNALLIDSGLLTHDECEALRPLVGSGFAREDADFALSSPEWRTADEPVAPQTPFVKTHDGWTRLPSGEPMLGRDARAAILIVRDPRGVAPSLAHHLGLDIDAAIAFMADPASTLCGGVRSQPVQLRQRLLGWSAFQASWLDQRDVPVHCLRYEDMVADGPRALGAALAAGGLAVSAGELARAVDLARFDRLREAEAHGTFHEAPARRRFFRKGQAQGWRCELTPTQIARIERDHGAMMTRLGYGPEILTDHDLKEEKPVS